VQRSGRFYPEIPDFLLVVVAHDELSAPASSEKSAICVPIKARGRTLGTITIVSVSRAAFTQTDLALAEDRSPLRWLTTRGSKRPCGENLRQAIIILNSSNNCGHSSE